MNDINDSKARERDELIKCLERHKNSYRKSARRWKVGYRVLLVLSAFLSAAAAIINQVLLTDWSEKLAIIFPATVTVIATIIATLDFDTNWRVNRAARHHIDILLIDMKDPEFDQKKAREQYKNIIRMRLDAFEKSD